MCAMSKHLSSLLEKYRRRKNRFECELSRNDDFHLRMQLRCLGDNRTKRQKHENNSQFDPLSHSLPSKCDDLSQRFGSISYLIQIKSNQMEVLHWFASDFECAGNETGARHCVRAAGRLCARVSPSIKIILCHCLSYHFTPSRRTEPLLIVD